MKDLNNAILENKFQTLATTLKDIVEVKFNEEALVDAKTFNVGFVHALKFLTQEVSRITVPKLTNKQHSVVGITAVSNFLRTESDFTKISQIKDVGILKFAEENADFNNALKTFIESTLLLGDERYEGMELKTFEVPEYLSNNELVKAIANCSDYNPNNLDQRLAASLAPFDLELGGTIDAITTYDYKLKKDVKAKIKEEVEMLVQMSEVEATIGSNNPNITIASCATLAYALVRLLGYNTEEEISNFIGGNKESQRILTILHQDFESFYADLCDYLGNSNADECVTENSVMDEIQRQCERHVVEARSWSSSGCGSSSSYEEEESGWSTAGKILGYTAGALALAYVGGVAYSYFTNSNHTIGDAIDDVNASIKDFFNIGGKLERF